MGIFFYLILVLFRIVDFISGPFFKFRAKKEKQYLPALSSDLLRISATELARKIRNKEISSEEICKVYINRIKDVNPILNAVVENRFRYALREAKQVDSYLNTTSLSTRELEKIKPLLGVPITVKESCSVKGLKSYLTIACTVCLKCNQKALVAGTKKDYLMKIKFDQRDMSSCVGLLSRKGFKADMDGEAVGKIRSCGGIILLVSTTPELCLSWECYSNVNGYTNNPYDTTCTSAGSSGGEGALLGAGASLVGIGSDIAGSIRLPAAFNGVFGHKPTPRITSTKGHFPIGQDEKYSEFLVVGPLVRYATDFKLIMNVMCGSRISSELELNHPVDISKLNVYYVEGLNFSYSLPRVSKEIICAVKESVGHLKSCGAKICEYKFEELNDVTAVCGSTLFSITDIPNVFKGENAPYIIEFFKAALGKSKFTFNLMHFYLLETIYKYIVGDHTVENSKLKTFILEKLGDKGVMILPTFTVTSLKHNQGIAKNGYAYMVLANALGLPATSIPCGFDRNGMPISVQVIAGPFRDRLCFAVAEELERRFGGWIPPPERNNVQKDHIISK